MSSDSGRHVESPALLDRGDERLKDRSGIAGSLKAFADRLQSGDLGSLPVVVGLIIIWTVFQTLNPVFLSPRNLVNLLFDCSTVGIISLGIVCVLMVGEIDLSVGSVSGLSSAILGVLWVRMGWPPALAMLAALAAGCLIGCMYALLLQPPRHAELRLDAVGPARLPWTPALHSRPDGLHQSSIRIPPGEVRPAPRHAAFRCPMCWPRFPASLTLVSRFRTARRRRAAGLSSRSMGGLLLEAGVITVVLETMVYYLNFARGVPWMFGLFVGLVVAMNYALRRTKWGRSMTAVGGNLEAARRAGIDVRLIYTSAFALCATLAAAGGLLSAARLASSNLQAGTVDVNLNAIAAAVIGGTSLFGGRGSAYSALLGIIVIQSIASGLTLLDLSSSLRYMITGGVLAIAVIVDSLARRSRVSHGRA